MGFYQESLSFDSPLLISRVQMQSHFSIDSSFHLCIVNRLFQPEYTSSFSFFKFSIIPNSHPLSLALCISCIYILKYLKKEKSPQKHKVRHISKLQAILESCGKLLGMVFGLCLVLMDTRSMYQLFSCNLHRCNNGVNIRVLAYVHMYTCVHKTKFACKTHKPYTVVDTKYILHRILGTKVGQK